MWRLRSVGRCEEGKKGDRRRDSVRMREEIWWMDGGMGSKSMCSFPLLAVELEKLHSIGIDVFQTDRHRGRIARVSFEGLLVGWGRQSNKGRRSKYAQQEASSNKSTTKATSACLPIQAFPPKAQSSNNTLLKIQQPNATNRKKEEDQEACPRPLS